MKIENVPFSPAQNDSRVECDGALGPPAQDVCVVMFSLLNRSSFQYAKRKVQDLRCQHNGKIAILLLGNKADVIQSRRVPSKGTVRVFIYWAYFTISEWLLEY